MKKITGLLAILLVGIITITACGGKNRNLRKHQAMQKVR